MTDNEPIACSLDAADLETRMAAVRDAGRADLISHEDEGGEHRLRFRPGQATWTQLEEIVRAERECCPFLSLGLEERDGEIVLSIEAPAGGEETAAGPRGRVRARRPERTTQRAPGHLLEWCSSDIG